jgi:uncharacterized membrane protein YqjE
MTGAVHEDPRSTSELVSDLSTQVSTLVKDELRLAGAELQSKGKRIGIGAGMFGAAGLLAAYGGMAAVACVVLAFSLIVAPWLAALITMVLLFAVAGVVALVGKSQLSKGTPPVPEQAMDNVKQDIETVKESAHR